MFTTLIVQPIFNLLVLIYALLPGHNFGLSIILFTIVVRFLMYPLVKKQLHQVKVMRKIQPELKRIKAAAKGNRQQESVMMMELYKERGINPFGSIGIMLLQIPILIGLYSGLRRVLDDPHQIVSFAYPGLQHLPWMKDLAANIHRFDSTLFHVVDLTRSALGPKGLYWPAMIIVLGSAVVQFYQSKQLTPTTKDSRKLRDILKDASSGKQADQTEVNAAVGRSTRFLLPVMVFLFTVNLPSALGLYWLVGGLVALGQQWWLLREDTDEMESEATAPSQGKAAVIEGEIVPTSSPKAVKPAKPVHKKPKKTSNRRKK
ncbi:MAG TPA: YidC/Oxa1 family membrane protein insertase [Candidatus Saccharimonadales bacterium]|nr:YidC/Oxa1 family membrane protein insertase [Candidatus Saccharimonadales bacterium]